MTIRKAKAGPAAGAADMRRGFDGLAERGASCAENGSVLGRCVRFSRTLPLRSGSESNARPSHTTNLALIFCMDHFVGADRIV
ncbi:MAG: hypothetical protein KTR19_04865 [Hyphomicrobiales bacterium]|nr:hypothetical protein [Hyphomicrobiales bacterium]